MLKNASDMADGLWRMANTCLFYPPALSAITTGRSVAPPPRGCRAGGLVVAAEQSGVSSRVMWYSFSGYRQRRWQRFW